MTQRTFKFKKGDRPDLDSVYSLLGLIPYDCYHQDDIGDSDPYSNNNENDSGESILFLKNVTIKIDIKVTEQP